MKHRIVTFLLMFLLSMSVSFAGGFQLNEHGSKPMGLGGAFTGIANDASAVYWNGAGLSFIEGTSIVIGSALIAPRTSFRGPTPLVDKTSMDAQDFFVPHFFISHKINEQFSVGAGVSVPFGLGTRWPSNWIGRYLAVETELKVFSVPLVVSYAVTDNFSISIGGSYNHATVTIKQKTPQSPFEGDAFVEMEGDEGAAFGYNFGFMWKPSDMVSIGGSFRSQVNYSFEGTATTTGAEQLSSLFPSGDISAELTTPVNIQGGIAVQVIEQLRLSADFQFVGWSSYDTLAVDIADFPTEQDIAQPRDYKDSYIIRFGAEFNVNDDISLLGGLYYDKFPVEPDNLSPSLPDSDRLGFSFGIDAKLYGNLGITGSYLFIRSAETSVTNSREYYTSGNSPFNGTYNSKANLFSLTFYYSFN